MSIKNEPIQLSDDLKFLIVCCQVDPSQQDIDFIQKHIEVIDHQELISLSLRHGVLPLVYRALKVHSSGFGDQTPEKSSSQNPEPRTRNPEILSAFKQQYLAIIQRNMLMSAELITLIKQAKALGIDLLPFKGPTLAQIAYGDITLRQFSDLDILIKREDFRKFTSVMLSRGYTPYFPIETFAGDKVMFNMNNDCPFYDKARSLSVEIHWDFFRKLALPTEGFEPWDEPLSVTINSYELQTLSHETLLLYHSLHGSKHVWERLGWIVDIDRLIRAVPELDWERVLSRAKSIGAQKMFLSGIALSERYFQTPLPEDIRNLCKKSDLEPFITYVEAELNSDNPAPEESIVKLSKIINLRDTFYYKAVNLLEFLFQPGINERRAVILPDSLFWFYWLIRPIGMGYRFLFCRLLHLCRQK